MPDFIKVEYGATGASKATQVSENFAALQVIPRLTPDVMARIADAVR